jgi:hypothetical protein
MGKCEWCAGALCLFSVIPAKAGIQVLNGPFALSPSKGELHFVVSALRTFEGYGAARRAAAGYFLVATRK